MERYIALLKANLDKGEHVFVLDVKNDSPSPIMFWIEPTGDGTQMQPDEVWQVVTVWAEGTYPPSLWLGDGELIIHFESFRGQVFSSGVTKLQ